MKVPSQQQALRQVAERLAELIHVDYLKVHWEAGGGNSIAGCLLRAGPFAFVVGWRNAGAAGQVSAAIEQLRKLAVENDGAVIPMVAVPFMGEAGRRTCAEAGIAWLDLSGNALIKAPGLHILVEGKPNRFKRRGRPSTAFAPMSSRIARWLLLHPRQFFTQREIARVTETDEGYTSRIVGKLEDDGLIIRGENSAFRARDPELLLDAWLEDYDFEKHDILRGHVAARSGDALLRKLVDGLNQASLPHAATGLAAAWLIDRFAGFRIATVYLAEDPTPELLAALSFRVEERGANAWLVVPNDEGIFHGVMNIDDIRCVHPVQIYLDLQSHPERAEEAAQKLRARHLNWRTRG
jgi:hypothetical protein